MTASTTDARPTRYAWAVLAVLCFVYVLNFLDRQLLSILAKPIQDDLGVTDGQLGRLGGLYFALFYCVLGIPVAWLADRGNRVRVLTIACALWSAATIACGLSAGYGQLAAARMSVGIGEAGGVPPSYSIISDYFAPRRRGLALGLFNLGPPLGQALGVAFGARIAAAYSWRYAFILLGATGVVAAGAVWAIVREPRRGATDPAYDAARDAQAAAAVTFRATIGLFFATPVLRLVAFAGGSDAVRDLRHARLHHAVPDAREGDDPRSGRAVVRADPRGRRRRRHLPVGPAARPLRDAVAADLRDDAGYRAGAGGTVLHRLRRRADVASGDAVPDRADLPQLFLPDAGGGPRPERRRAAAADARRRRPAADHEPDRARPRPDVARRGQRGAPRRAPA